MHAEAVTSACVPMFTPHERASNLFLQQTMSRPDRSPISLLSPARSCATCSQSREDSSHRHEVASHNEGWPEDAEACTPAKRALELVEICIRVIIHLDDFRDRARAACTSRTFRAAFAAAPLWRQVALGSGCLEWLTTKNDFVNVNKHDGRCTKGMSLSRVLKVVAGRPVARLAVSPALSMTDRTLQMMLIGSELLCGVDARHLTALDLRHSYAGERFADVVHSGALSALKELDLRGCLQMPETFVTCPTLRVYKFMWEDEMEIRQWVNFDQCASLQGRNPG